MNPEDATQPGSGGESLISLLGQLHGLREPPAISMWPATIAWAVAAVLIVVGGGLLLWRFIRHRRANAYRREALSRLDLVFATLPADQPDTLSQIDRLLRLVALVAYPRSDVAALTGRDWAQYLDKRTRTAPHGGFSAMEQGLTDAPYRAGPQPVDGARLRDLARHWIAHHDV